MEIASNSTPQNWCPDGAHTHDHHFDRRRIFGGQTERRRVCMMDLMDFLVKGTPVKCSVGPIVPRILNYEEDGDLVSHCEEGRKRYTGRQAEILSHRVKQPPI